MPQDGVLRDSVSDAIAVWETLVRSYISGNAVGGLDCDGFTKNANVFLEGWSINAVNLGGVRFDARIRLQDSCPLPLASSVDISADLRVIFRWGVESGDLWGGLRIELDIDDDDIFRCGWFAFVGILVLVVIAVVAGILTGGAAIGALIGLIVGVDSGIGASLLERSSTRGTMQQAMEDLWKSLKEVLLEIAPGTGFTKNIREVGLHQFQLDFVGVGFIGRLVRNSDLLGEGRTLLSYLSPLGLETGDVIRDIHSDASRLRLRLSLPARSVTTDLMGLYARNLARLLPARSSFFLQLASCDIPDSFLIRSKVDFMNPFPDRPYSITGLEVAPLWLSTVSGVSTRAFPITLAPSETIGVGPRFRCSREEYLELGTLEGMSIESDPDQQDGRPRQMAATRFVSVTIRSSFGVWQAVLIDPFASLMQASSTLAIDPETGQLLGLAAVCRSIADTTSRQPDRRDIFSEIDFRRLSLSLPEAIVFSALDGRSILPEFDPLRDAFERIALEQTLRGSIGPASREPSRVSLGGTILVSRPVEIFGALLLSAADVTNRR